MPAQRLSKAGLYQAIARIRNDLPIKDKQAVPLELPFILSGMDGIEVEYVPFENIAGFSIFGEHSHTICLSSNRNNQEQNFDCAHEYVHICLHGETGEGRGIGYSEETRNVFEEWQANEGAAELLVPHRHFIRRVASMYESLAAGDGIAVATPNIAHYLAGVYGVTPAVITYRFESLGYEISQFLRGTAPEEIEVVAKSKLNKGQKAGLLPVYETLMHAKVARAGENLYVHYCAEEYLPKGRIQKSRIERDPMQA